MAKRTRSNTLYKRVSNFTLSIPARSAIALAVSLSIQTGQAATLLVNNSTDPLVANSIGGDCTLREAVLSINQGTPTLTQTGDQPTGCGGTNFGSNDTIEFAASVTTIQTGFPAVGLFLERDVFVNPSQRVVTIDASNQSRHFVTITDGTNIRLNSLHLINGNTDFVVPSPGADPGNYGSSLAVVNGSSLSISNCTISGNSAPGGAAIVIDTAPSPATSDTSLIVDNSVISNNRSLLKGTNNQGGGIAIFRGSSARITNSTISNNLAQFGGGIYIGSGSDVAISNTTVSGNSAVNGAIDFSGAGGIDVRDSIFSATDSSIVSNMTEEQGGGILSVNSNLNLERSLVANNNADTAGGINIIGSDVSVENTTISGNFARNVGGIVISTGNPPAENTTAVINNTTIARNVSTESVGGLNILGNSNVTIRNSIFAKSTGPAGDNCTANLITATVTGDINSIVQATNYCGFGTNSDPKLLPLKNNGGPTKTHALGLTSAAVDVGNGATCLGNDQRGELRPGAGSATCDVGAFEQNSSDVAKLGGGFIVIPISNSKAVVIPN